MVNKIRLEKQRIITNYAEAEVEVVVMVKRFKPASNNIFQIVPRRYFCCGSNCLICWVINFCDVCTLCIAKFG